MSNLESYILKKYGRWVPWDICNKELLFDIKKNITINIRKDFIDCPVELNLMSDGLYFKELAHLLSLNMHLEEKVS